MLFGIVLLLNHRAIFGINIGLQNVFTVVCPIRDRRCGDSASKYFRLFGQYHTGGVSSVSFTVNANAVFVYELQRVLQIPIINSDYKIEIEYGEKMIFIFFFA